MSCVQQMLAFYYLTNMLIITFLSNNSMVSAFLSAKGVACETTPGSPPGMSLLIFSASSTDN